MQPGGDQKAHEQTSLLAPHRSWSSLRMKVICKLRNNTVFIEKLQSCQSGPHQNLIGTRLMEAKSPTNRRYLELREFSSMVDELRIGHVCVSGSNAFADYRAHLLSWRECTQRLPDYCAKVGLPENTQNFVAHLRRRADGRRTKSSMMGSGQTQSCNDRPKRRADPAPNRGKGNSRERDYLAGATQSPVAALQPARHSCDHRTLDALHAIFRAAHLQRSEDPQGGRALHADDQS